MEIRIRYATAEDCPQLMELINELAVYEKMPEELTVTLAEFRAAGFGAEPVWKAFVAEQNELTGEKAKIIGMALYYTRYSTWKGCRLYLEDFLVTESCRGKGVGKLLFERVIQEAKDKNYKGISWQVLDWNEPALNFYRKYQSKFEGGWLNASLSENEL